MTNSKNAFRAAGLATLLAGVGAVGLSLADTHGHEMRGAESPMMQGEKPEQMMGSDQHQVQGGDHAAGGQDAGAAITGDAPWTQAYREANAKMHAAMNAEFSGDADVDFARGMIAHHQGAIDMARVALEHGKDPELRQLAEQVISAQEGEIEFLRNWLAERDQ